MNFYSKLVEIYTLNIGFKSCNLISRQGVFNLFCKTFSSALVISLNPPTRKCSKYNESLFTFIDEKFYDILQKKLLRKGNHTKVNKSEARPSS